MSGERDGLLDAYAALLIERNTMRTQLEAVRMLALRRNPTEGVQARLLLAIVGSHPFTAPSRPLEGS